MNGVRRFFAATNAAASSSSSTPSTTTETTNEISTPPPKPPPLQTVFPLTVGGGKQLYPAETNPSVQAASPTTSPGTTTAGLFLRKDGPGSPRRKPAPTPDDKTLPPKPPSNPTSPSSTPTWKLFQTTTPLGPSVGITNGSTVSPLVAQRSTQPASSPDGDWKPVSTLVNTRDELLMSLLASEAVVDSRGFEVLSAEEVEELKREQQLLSSRLGAMRKKVALETKIRDAALNLQRLQTVKRLSKQTSEQVDSGNRKVDVATKELSKLMERVSDVDRKLLEHRAAVLSCSVRNLEAKMSPSNTSGEDTSSSGVISQGLNSPRSSVTSTSTRTKFDGAHLFAGHADSIVPGTSRKPANPAQIIALEEKLKAAEEELETARATESKLQKRIKSLVLEHSDVETTLNLELQTAEETISKLEREMTEIESAEQNKEEWQRERSALMSGLEEQKKLVSKAERKVLELETANTSALIAKDEEMRQLREEWDRERQRLTRVKREEVERVRADKTGLQATTEQLNAGRDALRSVVRSHKVPTSSADNSLPSLASSLDAHLAAMTSRLEKSEQERTELDRLRRKYEEDIRNGFDIRERLGREIEEARREREEARKENRILEVRVKEQSERVMELANVKSSAPSPAVYNKLSEDHTKILNSLRSLWSILPSVEARASNLKGNTLAPPSPGGSISLSDMDVRALKSLYDPKTSFGPPTSTGEFNVEEFVARVQALLADDRALIARLIRFAQSHDLLRNNAERAQKLAQESNKGLETYQSQVKGLEERNAIMNHKQLELLDEINSLRQKIEKNMQERRDLELQAAEQAETVQNLQTANNTLSARALAFAEEAASAPNALKAKLEGQLSDLQVKLKDAQDEIERMQSSESTQRVALLDELNSLQQENGKLRDQLRAKK